MLLFNQMEGLVRPCSKDKKFLKSSVIFEHIWYNTLNVSITLTSFVFNVSTVFHVVFVYICHRFNRISRMFLKKPTFQEIWNQTSASKCQRVPSKVSTRVSKGYCSVRLRPKKLSRELQMLLQTPPQIHSVAFRQSSTSFQPGLPDPNHQANALSVFVIKKCPRKSKFLHWTNMLPRHPFFYRMKILCLTPPLKRLDVLSVLTNVFS